jgi:hypothetical protein
MITTKGIAARGVIEGLQALGVFGST